MGTTILIFTVINLLTFHALARAVGLSRGPFICHLSLCTTDICPLTIPEKLDKSTSSPIDFSNPLRTQSISMKLAFPRLHVDASKAAALIQWYRQKLGMGILKEMTLHNGEKAYWIGYGDKPQSGYIELRTGTGKKDYFPKSDDTYWKIGLAVPDVDTARNKLMQNSVHVTEAGQFRDIGYLCHLMDPEHYAIELLQHDFEKNFSWERVATLMDTQLPLGQHVHMGQITLRISNLQNSLAFYRDALGMKLMSRQTIAGNFDLYFLGFTDEELPATDINAVQIREWLWKRPYTTLELQHFPNRWDADYTTANPATENGFSAMGLLADADRFSALREMASAQDAKEKYPEYETDVLEMQDPDGTAIVILQD